MAEPQGPVGPRTIVVQEKRVSSGAGLASIIFGIMGIFYFGIVFVPLSLIFGVIAVAKGQIGLGIAGLVCCGVAALTSPSLWAIFGASALFALWQ